jgi:hypothetical protein
MAVKQCDGVAALPMNGIDPASLIYSKGRDAGECGSEA